MRTGRPKAELVLSEDERAQLQSFARSRSLPAALSNRARIVLSSADGEPNNAIAERLKMTNATVGKWRARFIERRIAGLPSSTPDGRFLVPGVGSSVMNQWVGAAAAEIRVV